MAVRKESVKASGKELAGLYTLEVSIIDGPMTPEFAKKNKVISRTIEIRGDQTLEDLHEAIFEAFERFDSHMYEFQLRGEGPNDPKAERYVIPMNFGIFDDEKPAGTVEAAIGSLGLKKDEAFGYWFDFGDDWWHQINVLEIAEKAAKGRYPKVTKRVGESPPQYLEEEEDFEEEDFDDEEDDEEEDE